MSGCCERQYCRGDMRPFQMNVLHLQGAIFDSHFADNLFCTFDKPYKLSCLCCCRPEVISYYGNKESSKSFGKIDFPWTCCDPIFQVKDNSGALKYSITTDCCTCGFLCGNSCGCFSPVTMQIHKGEIGDPSQAVGQMVKHAMGFATLVSDADNYEIVFPKDASPEDKMNLIGAALLIDYSLFEEKNQGGQSNY